MYVKTGEYSNSSNVERILVRICIRIFLPNVICLNIGGAFCNEKSLVR